MFNSCNLRLWPFKVLSSDSANEHRANRYGNNRRMWSLLGTRGLRRTRDIALSIVCLFGMVGILIAGPGPAYAGSSSTTRYVSTSGTDKGGCTFASPCLTIAYAIAQSNADDTIDVLAGNYNTSASGTIVIGKDIKILGAGSSTTFVGGTAKNKRVLGPVFRIKKNTTVSISGLTIQYGNGIHKTHPSHNGGGGIYNKGNLTLFNDTISHNVALHSSLGGGGIYSGASGILLATNDVISYNRAKSSKGGLGGGISIDGKAKLIGDKISHNHARGQDGEGGGLYFSGSKSLVATNDIFSYNATPGALSGGGGLAINGSSSAKISLSNDSITHNVSGARGQGGGIYILKGTVNSSYDIISNNRVGKNGGGKSGYGGAICNWFGTFKSSMDQIENNSAKGGHSLGGGIFSYVGGQLNDDEISNNSAWSGGGFYNAGSVTLTNTTFSGNLAKKSGGGFYSAGSVTLTNTTFSGDLAKKSGGGFYNDNSATVTNSTFSGNSAPTRGGGAIYDSSAAKTTLAGDILANSTSGAASTTGSPPATAAITANCAEKSATSSFFDFGYNLSSDSSCGFTSTFSLSTTAPNLGSLVDNSGPTLTMAIVPGSPAYDVVPVSSGLCGPPATSTSFVPSGAVIPSSDQRGFPRPTGGSSYCSIGSFQYQPIVAAITVPTPPTLTSATSSLGSPTAPSPSSSPASVTLNWNPPANDGGSVVSGYYIYEGTSAGSESAVAVNSSPIVGTSYVITNLKEATTYYFYVKALNQAGFSQSSNELSATTSALSPSTLTPALSPSAISEGYRFTAGDGGVFDYGSAAFYGSLANSHLNQPIVGIASTPDGKGYWLVAADGGIFSFGDATFYGSLANHNLNQPIVGIASTPDGKGYWLVAADGGIFSFGDATFYGSMGSIPLNKPGVGIE
ncbi:putative outer membrane protein PmpB precursor [Acidithrix ferrooxidans]|uniref:Putative outer membrane protein PmpB n=1 Tax=Acidithrix ferrooxidans TaxID=1280514 RepID=A0A0D8HMS6_9ACTN|nr:putative outer membrane protein PmpB precursor [Acidithrix ferrooxidans]